MKIRCIWEHNGDDSLLYAESCPGAFTRGPSLPAALARMDAEIAAYLRWAGQDAPASPIEIEIVQEKSSGLEIRDADSDVLFDSERLPLTEPEYLALKALVLRSARDFHALYASIPDRQASVLPIRRTFYGQVPRTAEEMYHHTRSVNAYYFGEIGIAADNLGSISECRERGFALLEDVPGFLSLQPCTGSYGEEWSVRKMLRRFLWHDRIHAKAMYRMACRTFGPDAVPNPFHFTP